MNWLSYVFAAAVGLGAAFLVWLGAFMLFIPKGQGFTGFYESITMLALLPVVLIIGGVAGVLINRWTSTPRSNPSAPRSFRNEALASLPSPDPRKTTLNDEDEENVRLSFEERARR